MIFLIKNTGSDGLSKWFGVPYDLDNYRGTNRSSPGPSGDLEPFFEKRHPVALKICSMGANELTDIDEARSLLRNISKIMPDKKHEIIGCSIDLNEELPDYCMLLGYDVPICYYSSLVWEELGVVYDEKDNEYIVSPLYELCYSHFKNNLNEYGLFNNPEEALWFLDCMKMLNEIHPNRFDHCSHMDEYQVTMVSLVT